MESVVHPLVVQLRFARQEFMRGLEGMTAAEGIRRFDPLNSIGWMIGHLAWQEQRYWLKFAQGNILLPQVDTQFANGAPASTPPLDEALTYWRTITIASDAYLDSLTTNALTEHFLWNGMRVPESIGTMLRRTTYHYWYHTGESQAVRQLLGHTALAEFVGALGAEAPYQPE